MKRKAIYALGIGITAAAVIILVVARVTAPSDTSSTREGRVDSLESLNNFEGIDIAIKNVTAERDRDNEVNIQIQFRAFNPNKSTVILEAITYNVFANNTRIVSGDIGEKLEGFVASQSQFSQS
jgi:LEA14-like dessication related protein